MKAVDLATSYSDKTAMENDLESSRRRGPKRGFLNPDVVRGISFWTTSTCVLVAVVSCLLAIWKFTGTDALWRTVATCVVIGSGTIAFYWINTLFGHPLE
ncbi:MAG: hypothetical protein ABI923_02125 [bacterium]